MVSGSNRLGGVITNGTPSRSFVSDDTGNIVGETDLAASTTKELAYNHPGQLASVQVGGTPEGSYLYDYLSRLVSRSLPTTSTTLHLVHDLDGNVIAEYDASGTLLREYVWLDDRPVAAISAGTPAVTYWVHTDHLERPVLMTDASDAVVWQASYLPYGEVYSITGSASLDYRFPGQWFQSGIRPRLQLAPPLRRDDRALCTVRPAGDAGWAIKVGVCGEQPAHVCRS